MTGAACSGCGRSPVRARGLCNACYTIAYRRGDFGQLSDLPDAHPGGACQHPGCPERRHADGLCRHHVWQVRRYGRVIDPPRWWAPPGAWAARAACAADPDLMFAEDCRSIQAAGQVCAGCPVRRDCLAYGLDHAEPFGVWGGLTTEERATVLAGRRAVA